jgi:formate hydrogenlyase subunit 3/multisubunit Na+/H+ antiporter MnhD subunit
LHLIDLAVDPDHLENMNTMTFFIVTGVAQIFWVIPTARRWGKPWYYIGIVGNVALIVLWALTRLSANPITEAGEAEPITGIGIAVQIAQAAYIGLVISAIVIQKRMMRIGQKEADDAA